MDKIISNFNKLSLPAFLAQAQRIVDEMTGNTYFPEPWPPQVPSFAQLNTDLAAFANAFSATAAGDSTRIEERNAARSSLSQHLQQLAYYLQIAANGSDTMLASAGFPMRMPVPHTVITVPPAAPMGLQLDRGEVSGLLLVRFQRQAQTNAYDVQITSGDPTVEANWTEAGIFTNCRRIELPNLATLKTYSVRVRGINAAGPGGWTSPASLLVI